MAAKKITISRTESQQTEAWETPGGLDPEAPVYVDETDVAGDVCPTCGDPLTWHEQVCTPKAVPVVAESKLAPAPAADGFTFALGSLVLLDPQAQPVPVVWRGQLKERHPATGLVQRVPVYRLGDGFWDCYREDELQAA